MNNVDRFVPKEILELYEVHEARNGLAVLSAACPDEWHDIIATLSEFRLFRSEIVTPGGQKSKIAKRLDAGLLERGWVAKRFDTRIVVDGIKRISPTHEVDVFKNRVALEVEWNNKDPFYDRDLNNFRLLFDLGVIEVGVIITRCTHLQEIFVNAGREKGSFGASTAHMEKLIPRLKGGGGGGCPIVVFGISQACYVDDIKEQDSL